MAVSDLPGIPTGIWTLKKNISDAFESLIIISFSNGTVVLSISDTIEEVNDTSFSLNTESLLVSQLADSSYIQVT